MDRSTRPPVGAGAGAVLFGGRRGWLDLPPLDLGPGGDQEQTGAMVAESPSRAAIITLSYQSVTVWRGWRAGSAGAWLYGS